jgi:mono/diheme cytochrome c family protein
MGATTTTTTMGSGVDPAAGQADYVERCSGCHQAGSFDTSGAFGDLAGKGDNLVEDLGTIDALMDGLFMTPQEIADMAAFLDAL